MGKRTANAIVATDAGIRAVVDNRNDKQKTGRSILLSFVCLYEFAVLDNYSSQLKIGKK